MNRNSRLLPLSIVLALAACAQAPVHPSAPPTDALAVAAGTNVRLPRSNEPWLDSAWFAQTLSAERAVQAALLNNPRVRAELSRLDAAETERMQAGLISNPMLSLMALRPNGGGRWELDYGLMQGLYDLLARSRRIAVADAARQRTEAEVLVALLAIVQDTEWAYYRAVADGGRVQLMQAKLSLDRQLLILIERESRQGASSAVDVLEQKATAAMREHELAAARANEASSRAQLALLAGSTTATVLLLPKKMPTPRLDGLDAALAQQLALQYRPELAAGAAAVIEAGAERTLQSGLLRSTEPTLGPAGMRESSGMKLNGFELRLALPVFDDGRARVGLADARWREAGFRNEAQRRSVPLEVETALSMLAVNQVALKNASHHHEQQQLLAAFAVRSYQAGAGSFATRLAADQALLDSSLQLLDAEAALADSVIALQRATGAAIAALTPR